MGTEAALDVGRQAALDAVWPLIRDGEPMTWSDAVAIVETVLDAYLKAPKCSVDDPTDGCPKAHTDSQARASHAHNDDRQPGDR